MKITIKDIARESGYAVGTVSRVLNNRPDVSKTAREKIMEVVEKYNFRLNSNAKHLKQQAGSSIAVIVKGATNMLFASMMAQLQNDIEKQGYECLIYYINENDNENITKTTFFNHIKQCSFTTATYPQQAYYFSLFKFNGNIL